MKLEFNVSYQNIERTDKNKVIADSKNYLQASFEFQTAEWLGKIKTAVFARGELVKNIILDANNTCEVPWEVIKTGNFCVSVFAGDLITTNFVKIPVEGSGYRIGETPLPPTPDVYAQIIELLENLQAGEVSEQQIKNAVNEYLTENPVEGLTEEDVQNIISEYLTENPVGGVDSAEVEKIVTDYLAEHPAEGVTDEQIAEAVVAYLAEHPVSELSAEDVEQIVSDYLEKNPAESATDEQVVSAVTAYLTENPVAAGATAEQAEQIVQNAQDIATVTKDYYRTETITATLLTGPYIDGTSYIIKDYGTTTNLLHYFPIAKGNSYKIIMTDNTRMRVAFTDTIPTVNVQTYEYVLVDDTEYSFVNNTDYAYCVIHSVATTSTIVEETPPESRRVPIATPESVGGVMTENKTDDMIQSVGVDADGQLWFDPTLRKVEYTKTKGYISGTSYIFTSSSDSNVTIYFPIKPNNTYYIRAKGNNRLRVAFGTVKLENGMETSDYTIVDSESYDFVATAGYSYCYIHLGTVCESVGVCEKPSGKTEYYYDATKYGINTDAEDNTANLQLLMNTINKNGGGTIWFPVGTYNFGGTIYAKSNVSICGENINKTIFKKTIEGAYPLFSYLTGDADTPITGCKYMNFTVDEYDTGDVNSVEGKSFFYQYVKNCVFRDIILKGTIATALGIDYLDQVVIDNVTCIDCGRTYTGTEPGTSGIGIGTGGWDNENFIITNCVCVGCGQYGIFIENQYVLGWGGNVNYSKGNVIANCIVRNGLNNGIGIRGGQNVTVTGCESYENAKHGFYVEKKCKNIKITSCNAVQNKEDGILVNPDSTSDHVAIMGNTSLNNTGNGIKLSAAANGICISNNYTDGNAIGLKIDSIKLTDAVVKGNCAIDNVENNATFDGNTNFVDVTTE